jgi:hypothetical protein
MNRLLTWIGAMAVAAVAAGPASAFEGQYKVKGEAPGTVGKYEGFAQIKRTGATYSIAWQIGDVLYFGTAILTNDILSVAFMPVNARAGPGVASLRISEGKVTGGDWTAIGQKSLAREEWQPLPEKSERSTPEKLRDHSGQTPGDRRPLRSVMR